MHNEELSQAQLSRADIIREIQVKEDAMGGIL